MEIKCFNSCRQQTFGVSRQRIYNTFSILKEHSPNYNLKDLQVKYVIIPNDEAFNNVAFISQRFYAQVLVEKLGLQNSNTSNTYCRMFKPNTYIKSNQTILGEKN